MSASPVSKTTVKLLLSAVMMFVFAIFVMPPLYDVFCEVTGIGGKTSGPYTASGPATVEKDREITVQFLATNNGNMPWEFAPTAYKVRVNPGASTAISYYARNPTGRNMTAQAVPNVTPNNAAEFFHKTECFCFNSQTLQPGEDAELGLVFVIDPELPRGVNTITLSYTLFDVTERAAQAVAQLN